MLVLALDTSTNQSSIALCSEDRVLGEYTWYSNNNHSIELLNGIERLTKVSSLTLEQLDAVAVAIGPGSFNGVRVALAAAKSFAFALKKPLIGVCTLDICAAQQQLWSSPICSVQDAGRSELYAACYVFDEQQNSHGDDLPTMRQLGEYLLLTPQRLAAYLQEKYGDWFGVPGVRQLPPLLLCGDISNASLDALRTHLRQHSLFAGHIPSTRHASTLARLALLRLQAGLLDDPLTLEPLYLRRPSITTSTRKQPLLGGTAQSATGHTTTEREEGALRH
jgi:tRNA threonylcarbamoyladenosine biosynthesis protein TsaB